MTHKATKIGGRDLTPEGRTFNRNIARKSAPTVTLKLGGLRREHPVRGGAANNPKWATASARMKEVSNG